MGGGRLCAEVGRPGERRRWTDDAGFGSLVVGLQFGLTGWGGALIDSDGVRRGAKAIGFVPPVGGGSGFGDAVHGGGSDLDLAAVPVAIEDGGVERAVAVALGVGDIVVGEVGEGGEEALEDCQRLVAGGDVGHDDAQGAKVVNLVEGEFFEGHLAVDADDAFAAAVNSSPDSLVGEVGVDDDGESHHALAVEAAIAEGGADLVIEAGVAEEEDEILEEAEGAPEADAIDGRGGLKGEAEKPDSGAGRKEGG